MSEICFLVTRYVFAADDKNFLKRQAVAVDFVTNDLLITNADDSCYLCVDFVVGKEDLNCGCYY